MLKTTERIIAIADLLSGSKFAVGRHPYAARRGIGMR